MDTITYYRVGFDYEDEMVVCAICTTEEKAQKAVDIIVNELEHDAYYEEYVIELDSLTINDIQQEII